MGNYCCGNNIDFTEASNNVPTLDDFYKDIIIQGKVVDVYDGDTCKIVCFYPNSKKMVRYSCRMYGYDSPEMKPLKSNPNRDQEIEAAKRAKAYLVSLLEPINNIVWLYCRGLDKYGRLLVDIYHNKSDVNLKINSINDKMITEGHGVAYYGGTKQKFNQTSV